MHLVNDNFPHRCAVVPGRTKDPDGWVRTGVVLAGWDPEIEISVAGAKEIGKQIGMVPGERFEEIEAKLRDAVAELAVVRQRLDNMTELDELAGKVVELRPDPEPVAA